MERQVNDSSTAPEGEGERLSVPVAVFGKPSDPGPIPRAYGLLICNPALSGATQLLNRIAAGFKWKAATSGAGRLCFGFWPWDGGSIVLKILDAGRDDRGRPHTLRIYACLFSPGSPVTAAVISGLMQAEAWGDEPDDRGMVILRVREPDARLLAHVTEALAAAVPTSLLAGHPSEFENQVFNVIFDTATATVASCCVSALPEAAATTLSASAFSCGRPQSYGTEPRSAESPTPSVRRSSFVGRAAIVLAIILASVACGGYIQNLRGEIARRNTDLNKLSIDSKELSQNFSALTSEFHRAKKLLAVATRDIEARDSDLRQWKEAAGKVVKGKIPIPGDLLRWIEREQNFSLGAADMATLQQENDTMKRENVRLDEMLSQHVKELQDLAGKHNSDKLASKVAATQPLGEKEKQQR